MVCAEDIVSYFRTLKSYERIWIMCRLQHSCLPFELRFLGTCLEELGKKDFHELRQVENEANSTAEINLSELRKISDKNVQKKIILYLSLLYSYNYSCSNSLFKILYNFDEINSVLKYEASENNDDCFEYLLMMYTLAVNHPAFSCEQKQALHNIFTIIQAEENKRLSSKRKLTQVNIDPLESGPFNNTQVQVQECQNPISTSPENIYQSHPLPNPSHCFSTVPPPYGSDLPMSVAEQISIGLPTTGFLRYPFPTATSPQLLPCGWNTAVPIVFTTTEQTNTTHTFLSRSSSPSISNCASRCSSPSTRGRPISVPFSGSSHLPGPLSQQPASLPLPQTGIDSFGAVNGKDSSLPMNVAKNFSPEQLYRLSDEGLAAIGMTEESIQQLRCLADKMQSVNNDISPIRINNETVQFVDAETDKIKTFIEQSVPTTGLLYTASMAVSSNPVDNAAACTNTNLCHFCLSGQNNNQMNGFAAACTTDITSCLDHMRMFNLGSDAPSRNSNSSNSDTASTDPSPPNTPMLAQTNYNKRSAKSHSDTEWNNNNTNNNDNSSIKNTNNNHDNINNNVNDERINACDSSSEERNPVQPVIHHGRGRIVSNRGRSRSTNSYSRGRGNNRRRAENVNGNKEDPRKSQFSANSQEGTSFQFTTNAGTAPVTNATYIQSHYIPSYPPFHTNGFIRPAYAAYPPSREVLYQYPPPVGFLSHAPIPYSQIVPPKVSCYNCGGQDHLPDDCQESTMEEASKQGQYRLDYTAVEGAFTEK